MDPRRLRAWRASSYEAAGAVARIGRRSAAIDALLRRMGVRAAAFVGAWNPGGRRVAAGLNRIAGRRLAEAARRLVCRAGHGGFTRDDRRWHHRRSESRDPTKAWREAHLLIGVPPGRAVVLARRARQGGLVLVRIGAPARLVLLGPWGAVSDRRGRAASR